MRDKTRVIISRVKGKDEIVSKADLFAGQVKEAGGFYNMIITVASAFLGGSLLFLKDIAVHPDISTVWLLALGWLSLVYTIWLTAKVRRANLESIKLAMEREFGSAQEQDNRNDKRTDQLPWALTAGILLISIFGFLNLFGKAS